MMKHTKCALLGPAVMLATVLAISTGCSESSSSPTAPSPGGDTIAPTVAATTPANGAIDITTITATFSEQMLPSTISPVTFLLTGPGGIAVPGVVRYDVQSNMAIFTPSIALAPGTTYTVTIRSDVRDLAGNPMVADKVWTFTTPAAPHVPEVPRSD